MRMRRSRRAPTRPSGDKSRCDLWSCSVLLLLRAHLLFEATFDAAVLTVLFHCLLLCTQAALQMTAAQRQRCQTVRNSYLSSMSAIMTERQALNAQMQVVNTSCILLVLFRSRLLAP